MFALTLVIARHANDFAPGAVIPNFEGVIPRALGIVIEGSVGVILAHEMPGERQLDPRDPFCWGLQGILT